MQMPTTGHRQKAVACMPIQSLFGSDSLFVQRWKQVTLTKTVTEEIFPVFQTFLNLNPNYILKSMSLSCITQTKYLPVFTKLLSIIPLCQDCKLCTNLLPCLAHSFNWSAVGCKHYEVSYDYCFSKTLI